ncbi:MAG TPA: DUF4912 domain-containing protein [Pyrinomonadaceae bacterium]|nr:DUF4912 domain-containing protein [Pyrinomonadaceae bacterium]
MSEKENYADGPDILEFVPDELAAVSSGALHQQVERSADVADVIAKGSEAPAGGPQRSAAFKELSIPKLPPLERENRARLLMQTPTRIFFYWSTGSNPFQTLGRALPGQAANYSLILKLADLKRGIEEIHQIDAEGTWWFDVEADGEYRAEIGFYSPSRPFVRIMYSNTVETPRKSPSPHTAEEAEWRVSSDRFAKVLDVAGFKQDAFDVAIAGDDLAASDLSARRAFAGFIGHEDRAVEEISADELRYALLALAAGITLEGLRFRIGARLFALLQANAEKLNAANAMTTVRENFGVETDEFFEEESLSAVYGASLVNFPRTLKRRSGFPGKFEPLSSHSFDVGRSR